MKELGMAIGTAAGSIFGSLMGNKMQQDQFGNQLTLMKKQHEYNEASANTAQARAYEMLVFASSVSTPAVLLASALFLLACDSLSLIWLAKLAN